MTKRRGKPNRRAVMGADAGLTEWADAVRPLLETMSGEQQGQVLQGIDAAFRRQGARSVEISSVMRRAAPEVSNESGWGPILVAYPWLDRLTDDEKRQFLSELADVAATPAESYEAGTVKTIMARWQAGAT